MIDTTYNAKVIGKRLREIRKSKKMTQQDIADYLMVSVDSVSNYEHGNTNIGHDYIMKLCVLFNVSADYFYFGYDKNLIENNNEDVAFSAFFSKLDSEEKKRAFEIMKLVFPENAA